MKRKIKTINKGYGRNMKMITVSGFIFDEGAAPSLRKCNLTVKFSSDALGEVLRISTGNNPVFIVPFEAITVLIEETRKAGRS